MSCLFVSLPASSNYLNVFSLFLWSRDSEVLAVQSRNFKLCIALLFSSFYGVVFEVFSSLINCCGGTIILNRISIG